MRDRIRSSLSIAALGAAVVSCNALTGAGDLHVSGAGGGDSSASSDSGAGAGLGAGAGSSNASGAGAGATGTGAGLVTTGVGVGAGTPAASTTGAGGAAPTCSPACGANETCEAATLSCVCDPGFVSQGGACTAAPPGDPSTHTQADVCSHWASGHQTTDPSPLSASGAQCDAGTLSSGGITDSLTRIGMYRWLVGLGPVTDDPALDATAQACSNLESWWDWSSSASPHSPPSSATCYTSQGAQGAGESNIAWGPGSPANAIDQFITDQGNETTLGHRRWVLNPPLDPVGIGYWQSGGMYGNAACLVVFGQSGTGPEPSWTSIPNAGFTPIELTQGTWSFEGSLGGIPSATITVLRVDDATALSVMVNPLQQGFGQDAVSFVPQGWTAEAGKTYRVTVSGLSGGDVVYDVKPVACN